MPKLLAILVVTTLAGLACVYGEVEAVKIGYAIREQQQIRTQALDRNKALKYNIERLMASHNLERSLLAQDITLKAPKTWKTIVIPSAHSAHEPITALSHKKTPFLTRFFLGTAQAETRE